MSVSVRGLRKDFGPKTVLDGIDLEIAPGEILAIMGSSGGGKTTLLRCISGLIPPTAGEILVDGIDVQKDPEEARRHMGMVFQSAALFDYMTVEENILFGIRRTRQLSVRDARRIVAESLERVELRDVERKLPSELSGGMRKRVGIARAIALQPRVMLYDEPTTGLDPITTYTIDEMVVHLRETLQVTSLLVSHDVNSVIRTADRVAFLHQGRLEFLGQPEEFAQSEHPAIRELVRKAQTTRLGALD